MSFSPIPRRRSRKQTVPAGSLALGSSPKPSATISPSPQPNVAVGETPTPERPVETVTVPDDAGIQFQIDRTLTADPVLSKLDVSTLVEGGKVTVVGSVRSPDLKQRVEKTIRSIKGVVNVDNQLVITEATP